MEQAKVQEQLVHLSRLMQGGKELYAELLASFLEPMGYVLETEEHADRLILGPQQKVYTVLHHLYCWQSPEYGRWIWFELDSGVPHASSIVAALGMGAGARCPFYVMNLNLKMQLDAYNTVIGFREKRALPAYFKDFTPRYQDGDPPCLIVKDNPPGFHGVRRVFQLGPAPIDWSLEQARTAIHGWLGAVREAPASQDPGEHPYLREYTKMMLDLHDMEGKVFDAIFGQGWVSKLFTKHIFH